MIIHLTNVSPMPFGCVPIRQPAPPSRRSGCRNTGLQCLSAVCLSGRTRGAMVSHQDPLRLQCLSAVCLSGRGHRGGDHRVHGARLQCLSAVCLSGSKAARQAVTLDGTDVSNAFRLCAYPAAMSIKIGDDDSPESLQCLSAVCLSGRHIDDIDTTTLIGRLQCLSAVCLSGSPSGESRTHRGFRRLQCLSAVCLSGSREVHQVVAELASGVSNAFRLCAYPAGLPCGHDRGQAVPVSNAFRLCAYPAARGLPSIGLLRHCVSNAFRLCAYPAGLPCGHDRGQAVPVSNAFRLCAYPAESESGSERGSGSGTSPMPFGCVPIRQSFPQYGSSRDCYVSNAFRLCAYPAGLFGIVG